jgi:hypothetical protein
VIPGAETSGGWIPVEIASGSARSKPNSDAARMHRARSSINSGGAPASTEVSIGAEAEVLVEALPVGSAPHEAATAATTSRLTARVLTELTGRRILTAPRRPTECDGPTSTVASRTRIYAHEA